MSRNYTEIEKNIAKTGFFSEYLPPCFTLNESCFKYTPPENCDLIPPICFTMSRFNSNNSRRNIYIPEISTYIASREYIKRHNIIRELIEYADKSKNSFSPILDENHEIVLHEVVYGNAGFEIEEIPLSYVDNISKKIIRSTGAKAILKLDISNCYSSFYMHMIPCIPLGYDKADEEYKKTLKTPTDSTISPIYLKYKGLDTILRRQNENRTNGLLTGTLYSKIIIEAILSRIDHELTNLDIQFIRYVDDYEVFIYDKTSINKTISTFDSVLRKYGFTINAEKTTVVDFPYYIVENFEKIFAAKYSEHFTSAEIMDLFNTYFNFERNGTQGAIRFLLKSLETRPIQTDNLSLYKSYLLTILSNNERSLTKACLLLIQNKETLNFQRDDIDFINTLLSNNITANHDLETIWLLYLLIEINGITPEDAVVNSIINSRNELAQAMLLCANLISADNLTHVTENAKTWLLLYELYVSDIISEEDFDKKLSLNNSKNVYRKFKEKGIHFITLNQE